MLHWTSFLKQLVHLLILMNKRTFMYNAIIHRHILFLSEELKAKGVIITDIFTASREHSELVKKYFMTDGVKVDEHKLTALHAALMNGGVFVYVPKNVVVEDPIQVLFLHDDAQASLFNHVLIVSQKRIVQ